MESQRKSVYELDEMQPAGVGGGHGGGGHVRGNQEHVRNV